MPSSLQSKHSGSPRPDWSASCSAMSSAEMGGSAPVSTAMMEVLYTALCTPCSLMSRSLKMLP